MTKISNQYSLTNVLFADAVNGRVGIGTTSPTVALDVVGAARVSGISTFTATSASTSIFNSSDTNGGYITFQKSGTAYGFIGSAYHLLTPSGANNDLAVSANGSFIVGTGASLIPRMTITSSGYFSINSAVTSNGLVNIKQIGSARYGGINIYDDAGNTFLGLGNTGSLCVVEANYNTGSYTPLAFYTGGSERMRITSSGQVGIGASTSPTYLLEVSTAGGSQRIRVGTLQNNNNNSTFEAITTASNTTASSGWIRANAGGTMSIGTSSYTKSGGDSGNFANLSAESQTIAMTVVPNGNVLINTTTDIASTWKLQVNSLIATIGTDAALVYQNRNDSTKYTFYATGGFTYWYNGGNISQINMSNGAYTALSDVNKKKDFEQSNIGLNEVLQLKPTLYRMKTEDESSAKELGFIAQEVKEFIPQAYSESGEGEDKFIGLNQMPLIAALTKSIQEQQLQINELKALLNA